MSDVIFLRAFSVGAINRSYVFFWDEAALQGVPTLMGGLGMCHRQEQVRGKQERSV